MGVAGMALWGAWVRTESSLLAGTPYSRGSLAPETATRKHVLASTTPGPTALISSWRVANSTSKPTIDESGWAIGSMHRACGKRVWSCWSSKAASSDELSSSNKHSTVRHLSWLGKAVALVVPGPAYRLAQGST